MDQLSGKRIPFGLGTACFLPLNGLTRDKMRQFVDSAKPPALFAGVLRRIGEGEPTGLAWVAAMQSTRTVYRLTRHHGQQVFRVLRFATAR
jgi:hypothetical protein